MKYSTQQLKKVIISIVIIVIGCSFIDGGGEDIIRMEIKCIPWNSKYGRIHNVQNFKKSYEYYFKTEETDLENMFLDYADCIKKITSQRVLFKDSGKVIVYALVKIQFNKFKKVELYFNWNGDYCFKGVWYKRNSGLYFEIFKYFSDELFSQELLNECHKMSSDGFWHPE